MDERKLVSVSAWHVTLTTAQAQCIGAARAARQDGKEADERIHGGMFLESPKAIEQWLFPDGRSLDLTFPDVLEPRSKML